jgi:2-methylcitrate dehydratase PrpD
MTSPLARRIADEVISCVDVAPSGLDAAIAAVSDWAAVTIAGSQTEAPRLLTAALEPTTSADAASNGAELVGHGGRSHPVMAALINGTAAHALELDDIYSPGLFHPGAPTIAAALAVAQHRHASGATFLRSVALGYEIGNRIAVALNPGHYRMWHTTGTVGSISAAIAVSIVSGGDAEAVAHSIALSATMSAGLQQTFRSDAMGKPLHAGHAAQAGVIAGLAACAGMTGALDVLEGPVGLAAATGAHVDADTWQRVADPIDPDSLTICRTTVKPFPCCGHTFAAIDGALQLHARLKPLEISTVDVIEIATYDVAIAVAGIVAPRTSFEARFSLSYLVACALLRGVVTMASFDVDHLTDPVVKELAGRVKLVSSAPYEAVFPQRRGACVTVVAGGCTFSAECSDRPGDPNNALSPAALREKFDDLLGPTHSTENIAQLWTDIDALGGVGDVNVMRFSPAAPPLQRGDRSTD